MTRTRERAGAGAASTESRRTFLRAVGASGAAGLGSLAGCLGGFGGGPGTITFGVLNPMSGAYKGLGPEQRRGAKLGVEYVSESDEFDVEIDAVYEDTGTEGSTAQRKAQKVVEQDGADFLMGAISSSVALGLNEFAADEGVVYAPGAAAIPITGENCNEYVFRFETNTAQVAEACARWTVENLGGTVWFHVADYAYGNSVLAEWRSRMEGAGGFEEAGVSKSELGAGNFNSFISEIANSGADAVVVGMTGGDLITFLKQAKNQGLFDAVDVMTTTGSFQVVRGALGEAGAGVYSGVRYVPTLDTGDNPDFVSRFREAHDERPGNFARVGYDSIRMVARGIDETGSGDPADVKDALPGLEMQTIFGQNRFRECDHQSTNPVWVGQNVASDSGGTTRVKLLEKVAGPEAIPPCSDVNCSL